MSLDLYGAILSSERNAPSAPLQSDCRSIGCILLIKSCMPQGCPNLQDTFNIQHPFSPRVFYWCVGACWTPSWFAKHVIAPVVHITHLCRRPSRLVTMIVRPQMLASEIEKKSANGGASGWWKLVKNMLWLERYFLLFAMASGVIDRDSERLDPTES